MVQSRSSLKWEGRDLGRMSGLGRGCLLVLGTGVGWRSIFAGGLAEIDKAGMMTPIVL